MKFLFICLIGVFVVFNAYSQAGADSAMYNEGIDLLSKAKTTENYLEAAFYFGQLSAQQPSQWLIFYYGGLAYIQASQKALASNYKDDLLDKAQTQIDKAVSLNPMETELQVLQAFLFQARIQVNPQTRGLNYSQKADAWLKKALANEPGNPRAHFLQACNVYYTPVVFKGGPRNALPLFLKAREKFKAYTPDLPFMPDWGERENQEMIKLCNSAIN